VWKIVTGICWDKAVKKQCERCGRNVNGCERSVVMGSSRRRPLWFFHYSHKYFTWDIAQ
jgi:hypothetical protein